ncbi:MAG: hypothetical protein ACYS8W_08230 [Planctomycetota bacterium]|jgi:hypothetical protein
MTRYLKRFGMLFNGSQKAMPKRIMFSRIYGRRAEFESARRASANGTRGSSAKHIIAWAYGYMHQSFIFPL